MQNNSQLKIVILNLSVFFLSFSGLGQNEISMKFIGNCGLYLSDGTANLYIDFPYKSGAHHYMEYNQAELDSVKENAVFLFTHKHADHYSKKLLKRKTGAKFGPWNDNELKKMEGLIPDFQITSYRTPHKVFGISFEHCSYLIVWHGRKIYISGDTESPDTIATQTGLDVAFVPAWLVKYAVDKGIRLDTISNLIAIYHIGPNDNIIGDENNPKLILLKVSGQTILIPW